MVHVPVPPIHSSQTLTGTYPPPIGHPNGDYPSSSIGATFQDHHPGYLSQIYPPPVISLSEGHRRGDGPPDPTIHYERVGNHLICMVEEKCPMKVEVGFCQDGFIHHVVYHALTHELPVSPEDREIYEAMKERKRLSATKSRERKRRTRKQQPDQQE